MAESFPLKNIFVRNAHLLNAALVISIPLVFFAATIFYPLSLVIKTFVSEFAWKQIFSGANSFVIQTFAFTLKQAFFSATLTALLALPLAYIFANFTFPLRNMFLALGNLTFALPSIVVVFAFVIAYGNNGFFTLFLGYLGIKEVFLYRFEAIIAAHVFFNLPFGVKILTERFLSIPKEYSRTVSLIGLPRLKSMFFIEIPFVAKTWLNVTLLTFSLCLTSFAIVIILGGNPSLTTLEVGIYKALRFDFDLESASLLSLLQLSLSIGVALFSRFFEYRGFAKTTTLSAKTAKTPLSPCPAYLGILLLPFFFFLLIPLFSLGLDTVNAVVSLRGNLDKTILAAAGHATLISILIGCASSGFAIFISYLFCRSLVVLQEKFVGITNIVKEGLWIFFGLSPTVLGFAWYLSLQRYLNPFDIPFIPILFVHMVLSLPIIIRILLPAVEEVAKATRKSSTILALPFLQTMRQIELPLLKRNFISAFGVGFAFSFGEIAVASLFSSNSSETLPVLISHLMGSYHFAEAAVLSFLLAVCCSVMFIFSERIRV